MADYLPPVVARLTGDDSNLTTVLTRAKEKVRRFADEVSRMRATVQVDANMDQAALRRVQAQMDALTRARTARITADADTRAAADDLALLTRSRTVTIRTNVVGDTNRPGGGGAVGGGSGGGAGALATLISLAPALVPVAAGAAAVTASVAAATVAVGAFGAAVMPQIKALSAAATAQTTYTKAVAKYGPASQQAAQAQTAFADALSAMPSATRQAAGAVMVLKDSFKKWSDGLAQFTMVPVTRSLAVVQAILPKLSPMVQGASTQLGRLVTAAGGAVSSPGFDALSKRFSDFANKALKSATDGVMHFSRVLAGGAANGPISSFMAYVKTNGPLVKETLGNLAKAIMNILQGASQAGPGMLSLVNAVAKLVAALPPSFIATVLSAYSAFKLFSLVSPAFTAAGAGVTSLMTRMTALRAASVAAGGGVAGLRAAFIALGNAGKANLIILGITILAVALVKLSEVGRKAPPNIDKLTTSLGQLGRTGKASGEAARVMGAGLGELYNSVRAVSDPATIDNVQQAIMKVATLGFADSTPVKEAKQTLNGVDAALANLVKNGHADQAATAFALLKKQYAGGGHDVSQLTSQMDKYKSALADAKFEQQLAAQSMGLFGDQAQAVQKKLSAQKQTADGLRQSIQALNDVNRQAAGGQIAMEAAIDAANKAAKTNGKTLSFNTEKGRANRTALLDLASSTDDYTAKLLDQNASWDTVNAAAQRGRDSLIATAMRMGLNADGARKLADKYLKIPSQVKTFASFIKADAESALASMKKKLASFPKDKKTRASFEYKQARADLAYYQQLIDRIHGKTVTVQINGVATGVNAAQYYSQGPHAYGGVIHGYAGGGTVPGYAPLQDKVHAILSPGEGVLVPEAVRRMGGESGINSINRQARGSGAASLGGTVAPMGGQVAAGLWQGLSSRAGWLAAQVKAFALQTIPQPIADALGIASPSRVAASLGRWVGHGLVQGLTGSTASVKAATLRLSRSIQQVFHDDAQRQIAADKKSLAGLAGVKGRKAARKRAELRGDIRQQQRYLGQYSHIARFVEVDNARLLALAKRRDDVVSKLKAAQKKLADLQKAWTDERNQIASGIMSGVSVVTAAPQDGFALTGQDVLNKMRDQMARVQQFATNLAALKKKGLRSDLIEQLAAAGYDQGGDTAQALVGANKNTIDQINATQKNMKSAADATGKTVADAMYGAGIKSAQGLVKGLQSQEKAIERQMMKIAKAMERAIKKALGIKSPSTVMAELGDYAAQGMAVGIDRSAKHAVVAAQGMAMSVRQGATITGRSLAIGDASAGGGAVVHNHFEFHIEGSVATVDNLARDVEAAFLRRGMRNPVTYQSYKR